MRWLILLSILCACNKTTYKPRSFHVGLWGDKHAELSDYAFVLESEQDTGLPTIVNLTNWKDSVRVVNDLKGFRNIVAVVVDEPYLDDPFCPPQGANALKNTIDSIDPNVLVWVNYSEPELIRMMNGCNLNDQRINILSVDKYMTSIPLVYEDWLRYNKYNNQKIALVPGLYPRSSKYLYDYFSYADTYKDIWAVIGYNFSFMDSNYIDLWKEELNR